MLYGVYAAVVIVALPFFGRLSDRFGRRSLVALGLGLIAVGSLSLATTGTFLGLIGGRSLQGLGIAAMSAPAASALAELAGAQGQATAASITAVALAVGGAAAPLFSGITAEAFPLLPTASLVVCAGLAFTCVLTVALAPDPWRLRRLMSVQARPYLTKSAVSDARSIPTGDAGIRDISVDPGRVAFWQASVAVVACFGAQATFFTVSGPIFGTLMASHVLLTAGCSMSALMIASGLGAFFASRLRARVAIASGMALVAPGVCSFFGLVSVVPVLALTPAIAAIGLGHGLGYAGAIRLINETAKSAHRASYTSKFYVAIYVGGGLPVVGRGLLEQTFGSVAASAVFSIGIVALAIGVLTSLRFTAKESPLNE